MRAIILMKSAAWALTSILVAGIGTATAEKSERKSGSTTNPDADNTKQNKRYNGSSEATADQQENSKEAIETTRRIRSALTDDKSLSTYAHNVKIIWHDGEVMLRGPVRNDEEKRKVERIATKEARSTKVISEIQISGN
jgi:hypothetical protein